MSRKILVFLIAMFLLWTIGCSGGGNSPLTPDDTKPVDLKPLDADTLHFSDVSEARLPLGFYSISVDPSKQQVEFTSLRTVDMHLNAVVLLETGTMLVEVASPPVFSEGGKKLDIDIRIKHPNPDPMFTGFDVHGIFLTKGTNDAWTNFAIRTASQSETRLINADGWTRWWNPADFTQGGMFGYQQGKLGGVIPGAQAATVNGYKTFADGLTASSDLSSLDPAKRGMLTAGSQCTRHYTISFKGGILFNYAVDASWASPTVKPPTPPGDFPPNANMPEAYRIDVQEWVNTLWYQQWQGFGGNVFYYITVYDWQGKDTIGGVDIEIPQINLNDDVWSVIEEGPNYKKFEYRVILPELVTSDDLDVLFSVESPASNYQPAVTGVTGPLSAYVLHTTVVGDTDPVFNKLPICIMHATTATDIIKDQTVSFDASPSYDPDGEVIDYTWDFNADGYYGDAWTSGTAAKPVKKFTAFGNYQVRCKIEDDNHAMVISAPVLVNVTSNDNLMPFSIAEATTDTSIMSDGTVTFDASDSYDIDGTIASYLWDFNGDGTYGDTYDSGTDVKPIVSWPAGEYDVDLKVIDDEAGYDVLDDTIHVTVGNYGPTADAIATTETVIVTGQSVTFDSSASVDPDGSIALRQWDFNGDGTFGDAYEAGDDIYPQKTFTTAGDFNVDLKVTDNLGATDQMDLLIHVSVTNPPPVADAVAVTSTDIFKTQTVEFDASASYDPNGTIVNYDWDFNGDGTYGDTYGSGTPTNPVKQFIAGGTFNVDLRVTDNNGATDTLTSKITVHVANQTPTACFEFALDPPYYYNTLYSISGDCSNDPDGSIALYEWDLNYDGSFNSTKTGKDILASWNPEGTYQIQLRVTDDDGATDMLDQPVEIDVLWIDNLPPIVDSIGMSRTTTKKATAAEAITFTCNAHDPNVGDNLTYEWTCAAGSFIGATNQQTAQWMSPDLVSHQTVKCRVYDNYGAWDEMDSNTIRVTKYPTADMTPVTAPAAYYWELETLWSTTKVKLADYNPGKVIMMDGWQYT